MNRIFFIIFLLTFAFIVRPGSAVIEGTPESSGCIKCHQHMYQDALASPYQHGMILDRCSLCHISQGVDETGEEFRVEKEEERKISIDFPAYQKEGDFHLDNLEDGRKYELELTVTDHSGRVSRPYHLTLIPEKAELLHEDFNMLKQLSGVTLEEVKMGVFVEATVSWVTDAPATSEVEYRLLNDRHEMSEQSSELIKEHRVTLTGLKHRHRYLYKVISRDMKGNVLRSGEAEFDTSVEIISDRQYIEDNEVSPVIHEVIPFRAGGQSGIYLRMRANKPSRLSVLLKEVKTESEETGIREKSAAAEKHSPALASARYSTIDACIKCHNQNASHPVGVRSKSDKFRAPDDLPTIDNGIITCVTCHLPHGGKEIYLARLNFDKDICIKCHTKNY